MVELGRVCIAVFGIEVGCHCGHAPSGTKITKLRAKCILTTPRRIGVGPLARDIGEMGEIPLPQKDMEALRLEDHPPGSIIDDLDGQPAVWHDILPLLDSASDEMTLGDLLHGDHFHLQEAMSALEMGDPQMDSMASAEPEAPAPSLPPENVPVADIIGVLDEVVCYEHAWYSSFPLAHSLFRLDWLHCVHEVPPRLHRRPPPPHLRLPRLHLVHCLLRIAAGLHRLLRHRHLRRLAGKSRRVARAAARGHQERGGGAQHGAAGGRGG